MIQETEMKQRLARMVGLLRSFQFMNFSLGQDVLVATFFVSISAWGGSSQSPQVSHPSYYHGPIQKIDVDHAPPEMIKAAQGLEAIFTAKMMEAMRKTVEPSEFSLHNSATEIYQGMLDQEYADTSARTNSLGLARQIVDYMLRSQANPQYTNHRDPQPIDLARSRVEKGRTGGTHEGQSSE